jgi:ubiquinone/menaquinone biosynthesis C-methylase UbiE
MYATFQLNQKIKSTIKKINPNSISRKLRSLSSKLENIYADQQLVKARRVFEKSPGTPIWLETKKLETLQNKYPWLVIDSKDYIQDDEKRGEQQAKYILHIISREKAKINNFLELGCGYGLLSYSLQKMGGTTTAIDINSTRFSEKGVREGVTFLHMNAAHLQFEDEKFDFIFSFNAFEHFPDPEAVLREAIRVVKAGGYIYLNFDPLYMSPWGLHEWNSITFPYCQFLFPLEQLKEFADEKGLKLLLPHLNGWSVEKYRDLWRRYSDKLETRQYQERYNTSYLDLIRKYPSAFKSKTECFDNLIVSGIEVLFKKIK